MVAQGEQGGDGAGRLGRDVVAAAPSGFADEFVAAELAQVVGGLAGGEGVVAGDGVDLVGKVGDGEPVGRGGEGGDRGQGGAGAGFVEVDTADPGPADNRRLG